jgi:NADPH:quinone reductase-like Zn-dependent oxidoreductase
MMKAILIQHFGEPETLQLIEVQTPIINDDQVLIKVINAAVNPVDTKIRAGAHISCKDLKLPAILGKDMSGIIEQTGKNVQNFKPGDAVFGCIANTYAEYVAASPQSIVKKPDNVSFDEAAGVSLAGLTAYQAINEHLQISKGQRILIQSAAGGVGHLAVQFAKLNGAYVYGTASGKNATFLTELGVDHPINYKTEKFEEITTDLDAVMDTMGGEILYRSIACVKPGGKVICLPSSTKNDPKALELARERNVELIWSMMQPDQKELQLFATLFEEGKLKVKVDQTFPLNEIVQAHQVMETHGVSGKIVIQVSSDRL